MASLTKSNKLVKWIYLL